MIKNNISPRITISKKGKIRLNTAAKVFEFTLTSENPGKDLMTLARKEIRKINPRIDMVDVGLDTYTDLFIPLPFNGLDYSNTYRIYLYSPTADSLNYWTYDTNTDNAGIDGSWRTIHKKTTKIAEYASGPYTGDAAIPGGGYNEEADTGIQVKVAPTHADASGTISINGELSSF